MHEPVEDLLEKVKKWGQELFYENEKWKETKGRNDDSKRVPRMSNAEYERRRREQCCLRCSKKGHWLTECKNPANKFDMTTEKKRMINEID
jgi:hypothetical protein